MANDISSALTEAVHKRETNFRNAKVAALGTLSLLLQVSVWSLMHAALYNGRPLSYWGWVALASAVWIAVTAFFALVNPHRWVFAAVNVVGLIVYLLLMPKDPYVILGGALFFLLSLLFQKRIGTEEKNQLHFSIRRTVSSGILIATYALLFAIGFNLYYNTSEEFEKDPGRFYESLGEASARSVPFLSDNSSGVDLNQPLDQYLTERAEQSLPEDVQQAPASVREEYVANIKNQFLQNLGITPEQNETIAQAMTRLLEQKSREVLGPYERFFPLIFTIIVIALLRTFSFVFNWAAIFITWLFFRILLALKFFRIGKAKVEVDKLEV